MSLIPAKSGSDEANFAQPLYTPIKRRSFFMYAGATAGASALVLAGCSKDDTTTPAVVLPTGNSTNTDGSISLGSGDVGVLNYAYALEQLEAAFYAQVVRTPASDFMGPELNYFTEVAKHEALHRDFFKAALTRDAPGQVLRDLTPIFTTVNFAQRASVLDTAMAFEDLGVSAYNGAGKLIKTADYLIIAGQIVSVEARHAAIIRDFKANGTFSDTADANGLDLAKTPAQVLMTAQAYVQQKLEGNSIGK